MRHICCENVGERQRKKERGGAEGETSTKWPTQNQNGIMFFWIDDMPNDGRSTRVHIFFSRGNGIQRTLPSFMW